MHFCRLVTRALCSAAFSVSLIAASPAQTPPSHPPVEAFGALPAISDVSLSPDGKHIAALQTYHGRTAVVIYEVGAPPGTVPAILIDEMHYIVGARWAKNDRLLVTIYEATRPNLSSTRTYPFLRMFSVDTKAQNPVMLLQNSQWTDYQNNTARIADLTLDDPENIIMPQFAAHLTYTSLDLYKVSVRTGRGELALQGKAMQNGMENTIYYIMDGHGHVVGRVDQIQEPLVDHLRINKDEYWQEVAQFDAETDHGADLVGMSVDGAQLIRFDTSDESGTTSVAGFEIATGRTVSIFKNPTFDVYALFLNCWTRRVLGVDYVDDLYKIKWFDPSMQALQRGLEAAFPGSNVILVSHDVAFEKVIVRVSSVSEPWTYYLLDRKTHLAGRIGVSYPLIHSHDLGAVKPYPYKARDGLDIPGYLTLPPGKEPKNLPLVVIPHGASSGGGPDSRDSMDFNWLTQFLANRGYAVLQPNYRGSFGYGYPFRKAGFKQWGLKTQDDVTDGVNKVIADGIADPKRVCIYGADYGGYIALEGAELTPQLYRCVISYAGISDWLDYLRIWEEEARPHSKTMSYLNSRIGVASEDHEKLKATSPALHAEKIMSPVLLMHGESDYTVRIHQSQEMYDALRQAGKQVQFIKFTGEEDHYLQQAESRIRLLTEIEKFLKENIGN